MSTNCLPDQERKNFALFVILIIHIILIILIILVILVIPIPILILILLTGVIGYRQVNKSQNNLLSINRWDWHGIEPVFPVLVFWFSELPLD